MFDFKDIFLFTFVQKKTKFWSGQFSMSIRDLEAKEVDMGAHGFCYFVLPWDWNDIWKENHFS